MKVILLSVRAPVGRINIATTKLVLGRGLCSIKHKKGLQNYFLYLLKTISTRKTHLETEQYLMLLQTTNPRPLAPPSDQRKLSVEHLVEEDCLLNA